MCILVTLGFTSNIHLNSTFNDTDSRYDHTLYHIFYISFVLQMITALTLFTLVFQGHSSSHNSSSSSVHTTMGSTHMTSPATNTGPVTWESQRWRPAVTAWPSWTTTPRTWRRTATTFITCSVALGLNCVSIRMRKVDCEQFMYLN